MGINVRVLHLDKDTGVWGMKKELIWVAALGLAAPWTVTHAQAQSTVAPYEEHSKFTRAAQQVSPLTSELFGDNISLYNGSTEFSVTDISLPGNNGLPVQLTRRFKVEPRKDLVNLGGFGVWDLDVPYIAGNFDSRYKWNESETPQSRCSSGNWGPRLPGPPFSMGDLFTGIRIHLPGRSGGDLLKPASGNPHRPTDGAAYTYVSQHFISVTCVATTKNGYPGEGFVAVTTDGLRYTFNVGVERHGGIVRKDLVTYSGTYRHTRGRTQVFLLAGRVEDRYGNWVEYDYAGDQLTAIHSSDGRRIDLGYSGNTIAWASSNGRTWRYEYTPITFGLNLHNHLLTRVEQPDRSVWTYQYEDADGCTGVGSDGCPGMLGPEYHILDVETSTDPRCPEPFVGVDLFTLRATHPSGAAGEFRFGYGRHYRTQTPNNTCVPRAVPGMADLVYELQFPDYFDGYGIISKTLNGPGLEQQTWGYGGGGPRCRWGANCPDRKTVTVQQPDGTRMEYVFGIKYGVNDGKLLETRTVSPSGTVMRSEVSTYVSADEAATMPFPDYYGFSYYGPDDGLALRLRPIKQTTVTQDGATFTRTVEAFDALARPTRVTKSSSLDYGRYSRTEETTYHDNRSKWLLGQVQQITQVSPAPSVVMVRTDYDAADLPWRQHSFGWVQHTLGYHADGTLATVTDGRNNTTTLSGWKRGIPQMIQFANGATQSAAVDGNGWIHSVTDENGFTTKYDYDEMGRMTLVDYPDGDTVDWANTVSSFAPVAASEYGLPAGHWKQTVSTGNARRVTYFDGLWRPVVEEQYDAANVPDTLSQSVKRYDLGGRLAFQSNPMRGVSDFTAVGHGMRTEYDALGRVVKVTQDSELGPLETITDYLPGFQIRVTPPRKTPTTTSFMAYDQPTTDWPVAITHPEGAYTDVVRDAFGKPLQLRRRNADSTVALTRQYVYDAQQRLCKAIEPETGATVTAYDAAGNVDWTAAGLSLTNPANCNTADAYNSMRRVQRSYDAMNRLTGLSFSDGNGGQNWAYWPDGLVKQIDTSNVVDNVPVTATNTYNYNKRRLLTSETLSQQGGESWGLGYGYDANGHLANHTYPSGLNVVYAPNALGQPQQAGAYAAGVRYHPNGGMAQFTYGNGLVHTMSQNARGLPERSRDASGSVIALDDSYDYDAHANVAAISDALPDNRGNRDMTYDGLDRLRTATSAMFGAASYVYDVLDNLAKVKVAGRDQTYVYDASHRLTNVMAGSSTVVGLSYDLQGNLNNKNGQVFVFDYGNRLRTGASENYRYDGHGRRIQASHPVKGDILSLYGQDGVLRFQRNQREAKAIDYVTLNGSLVAQVKRLSAPAGPVVSVPGYSTNGAYIVGWNAVTGASTYAVEESADGSAWEPVYTGSGQSQAITGRDNGAYTYRAQACNAAGCGPWSALATVFVQRPPNVPGGITVPTSGPNGVYTVSWLPPTPSKVGATEYQLEESFKGGPWVEAYAGENQSKDFAGKAAGTYAYRVKACNLYGCSPEVTGANTVLVRYAPGAPDVWVPDRNLTGGYSVSWSGVADTTNYQLDEQFNGGSWTRVHDIDATSVWVDGRKTGVYGYRVAACNPVGCSAVSDTANIQVIVPPSVAPGGLGAPANSNNGHYGVSWWGVEHATYYQLVERVNGGGWVVVHNAAGGGYWAGGRGTGNWEYMVRACNEAGCGPYSALVGVSVLLPPATPSITSSMKIQTMYSPIRLACSVSWTPVAHADRYELWSYSNGQVYQRQHNGPAASVGTTINQNRATYCAPQHIVLACNASGCSGWSAPATQIVDYIDNGGGGGGGGGVIP